MSEDPPDTPIPPDDDAIGEAYRKGWYDAVAACSAQLLAALAELPPPPVEGFRHRCVLCQELLQLGEPADGVWHDAYGNVMFQHRTIACQDAHPADPTFHIGGHRSCPKALRAAAEAAEDLGEPLTPPDAGSLPTEPYDAPTVTPEPEPQAPERPKRARPDYAVITEEPIHLPNSGIGWFATPRHRSGPVRLAKPGEGPHVVKLGDLMGFNIWPRDPSGDQVVTIQCQRCDWDNSDKPQRITLMELARDALEHIREAQCRR